MDGGPALADLSNKTLDLLKDLDSAIWAGLTAELDKDEPNPALNRFFVRGHTQEKSAADLAADLQMLGPQYLK